jgi:hypothetical protein
MVSRTLSGAWGSGADAAWQWFVPAIGPNLSLIVSVLAASALNSDGAPNLQVRGAFFWLTLGLSTAYLSGVLVVVLVAAHLQSLEPMKTAALYMGFVQSLVSVAIGALFASGKK